MKAKLLIFFATLLFLTTTIAFCWNEKINLAGVLNHDRFGSYATVIGSIATTIAMVFLAMQLKQMESARTATYKPVLVPEDCFFYTKNSAKDSEFRIIYPEFFLDENFTQKTTPDPMIKLFNVGKGIAKSLRVTWEFDYLEVKKLINNSYYIPANFDIGSIEDFGFINENNSVIIHIPSNYMLCCGINLNAANAPSKPKLSVKLFYRDLHDSELISKKFQVIMNVSKHQISVHFKEP